MKRSGSVTGKTSADPAEDHLGKIPRSSPYWFHANSPTIKLNEYESKAFKSAFSRLELRTGYGSESVHRSQSSTCALLPKGCWPRISGSLAWPSSPNLNEKLDMLRRGVKDTYAGVNTHARAPGFTKCTLRQFNENIELVKRIVSHSVYGIRSDVAVPIQYRKYFCYRWNFLILSTHGNMPAGLARFLASKWITNPSSLWLDRRVSLKQYLRQVPSAIFDRAVAVFSEHQFDWYSKEESSFTSSDSDSSTTSWTS